jgi:uncharacterized protein YbgA (DUF1722 family)/uncharacterized protein YbbK (DUF523 family)
MTTFARPQLVISRCIELDHCRWNGLMISSDVVKLLKPHVDLLPVCGEVEIGLGVPRDPIRLISEESAVRLYQPATGRDCTAEMVAFVSRHLDALPPVDGFLLKSRSPTCGMKDVKIYPGRAGQGAPRTDGVGLFAQAVLARYPHLAVEDEGRLTNYGIRDHFLTRLFTQAEFRALAAAPTVKKLMDFQEKHKLLLMAYDQETMRALGRIVANHERLPLAQVVADYGQGLAQALARAPRYTAHINVMMHALGYFSEGLNAAEKQYLLDCLEDYRQGQLPLSVPTGILRAWVIRFSQTYLAGQSFFMPYPEELVAISDSGKGRDL